jgi:hypothetical protein
LPTPLAWGVGIFKGCCMGKELGLNSFLNHCYPLLSYENSLIIKNCAVSFSAIELGLNHTEIV